MYIFVNIVYYELMKNHDYEAPNRSLNAQLELQLSSSSKYRLRDHDCQ